MSFLVQRIARKYVLSSSNKGVVNLITLVAVFALSFITMAMLVIVNIFSGLEELNLKVYNDVEAEIRLSPAKGKLIKNAKNIQQKLLEIEGLQVAEPVVEEKAYVAYGESQEIVYLKGIGSNYTEVTRIDTLLLAGDFLSEEDNSYIISDELAAKLEVFINTDLPTKIFVPRAGKGLISSEKEAFNELLSYPSGVFFINDNYSNYLFMSIDKVRELLELNIDEAYFFEIRSDESTDYQKLKSRIQQGLGSDFKVETREELNSAFLKLMNTEKLIIYLLFVLLIGIATFNLAGALIVVILDKQDQIKTLHSMGMNKKQIKNIFLYTGMFIGLLSLIIGLSLGSLISLGQYYFGWVKATVNLAFPIQFSWLNLLIIALVVFGITSSVSWLISQRAKINL